MCKISKFHKTLSGVFPAVDFALMRIRGVTLGIAAAGCVVFLVLGLPLPFLFGPMFACLAAALANRRMADMGLLAVFMRTVLGVAVGASITPALVQQLPGMAFSLAAMPLFVLAVGAVGYPLLRCCFGFSHPTAYYAAMPGGLQDMLVFGEEAGGNVRALSLVHATRILVIVTAAPLLISHFWQVDLTAPPGAPLRDAAPLEVFLMLASGLAGWRLAAAAGMFGASIIGPMIAAAALSLAGLINHRPPAEIIWAAQFFVGLAVGVKYVGVTAAELRRYVVAGLVYSVPLAGLSILFFMAVRALALAPSLEALLAFLPGGQAEMVVVAIIAGADLAFVVSHHLMRLVFVILFAPVAARLFAKS